MVDTQSNINQNITVKMKSDKDFLTLTKKLFKKLIKTISKEEWRNIAFEATQIIFEAYSYSKKESIITVPK